MKQIPQVRWMLVILTMTVIVFCRYDLQASTFDDETGRLALDAAVSWGFDGPSEDFPLTIFDWR